MNIHAILQAADVCKNVTSMSISQESLLGIAAIIFFIHHFMLHFHLIIHVSAQYTATSFSFLFYFYTLVLQLLLQLPAQLQANMFNHARQIMQSTRNRLSSDRLA